MPLKPLKSAVSLPILEWINASGQHRYQITPEDRLTLIRSVWREGKPQTAVAFTLLQRFTHIYPKYKSLSAFVTAYSQPINPRWFPTGDKHLAAIKALQAKKQNQNVRDAIAKLEARAKRRPVFAKTTEIKIPIGIRYLVDNILYGRVQSPVPTATHFSASQATSSDSPQTAKTKALNYAKRGNFGGVVPIKSGFGPDVNWFFSGRDPNQKLFALRTPITPIKPIKPDQRIAIPNGSPSWSFALLALGIAIMWISANEQSIRN